MQYIELNDTFEYRLTYKWKYVQFICFEISHLIRFFDPTLRIDLTIDFNITIVLKLISLHIGFEVVYRFT